MPAGQASQALWQIVLGRHDCALCQDRDDPHVAVQGRLDFQPDDIVRIVKPSAPFVGHGQPGRADDHQQHLAGRHRPEDLLGEVNAWLDRVHIDEDLALTETLGQAVRQPTSKMTAFLPTVTDEDAPALNCSHVQSRYRRGIWAETPVHAV
jgi:hypothetical protein